MIRTFLCVLIAGILFFPHSSADTLHLKNGKPPLEGLVEDAGDQYLIHLRNGSRYVAKAEVERFEPGDVPWVAYTSSAAAAEAEDTAEARWALAKWCLEHGLREEQREQCHAVLAKDPNHAEARKAVGFVKADRDWVPAGREEAWRRGAAARAWLADPKNAAMRGSIAEAIRFALLATEQKHRDQLCKTIREIGSVPFGVYEALIRDTPSGDAPANATGRLAFDITIPSDKSRTQYLLVVPDGYDPSRRWPLLVQMHGTGMSGEGELARFRTLAEEHGALLAAPQAASKNWDKGWGSTDVERETTLVTIDDVMRRYNVDPDRVFLGGLSMGGNGSWEIGMLYADRFAGIAPEIGAPRLVNFGYLENLRQTSIFSIVGALDQEQMVWNNREAVKMLGAIGADVTYNEFAQYGHQPISSESARYLDWTRWRARDPYPPSIDWSLNHLEHGRAWWIRVDKFTKPVWDPYTDREVKVEKGADREATLRAYIAKCRKQIAHVKADVTSPTRIDITCDQVAELSVYLTDALLDLDQPIEIWANRKKAFAGRVDRSLDFAIEHVISSNDRGRVFANEVKIRVK